MSQAAKLPLPDYESPPVIEVVCGIQFEPLPKFQAASLGLFWQRVRDEYTCAQEVPPLPAVVERFGVDAMPTSPQAELSAVPPLPRMFFVHREPSWLIQLQRERFLHNWRKDKESEVYPRYPAVFEKFWKAWVRFVQFCRDEDLGNPGINQLEITYINHIPSGAAWESLADVAKVFPDLSWRNAARFLPSPESVGLRLAFALPESQGRLHVSLKHAIRVADDQPVLLCELTARGMPRGSDEAAIRDWFDLGREWIVRGFADLVGEAVQRECWGRKV